MAILHCTVCRMSWSPADFITEALPCPGCRIATLEAENARLRGELEAARVRSGGWRTEYDAAAEENARLRAEKQALYSDLLEATAMKSLLCGERDAARANLERVTGERDRADIGLKSYAAALEAEERKTDAARQSLEEAVRLLRENETSQRCYESLMRDGERAPEDDGFEMCTYCGDEVDSDDCASAGDCWGAKVRAFLASHPTPEPKEPTM